ncbi:MAG: hypothetical protein J6J33_00640, partial [Clostridia bacterium]|nr:hypothetical protein [Clostridia bacterium]
LTANKYSMVGYTFLGYSTGSDWTNASTWTNISAADWAIANDSDIYSMNPTTISTDRGFFSYNFYIAATDEYCFTPTFVSHETTAGYDYNFYNVIKDQIHNSMYNGGKINLYAMWKANKYNIVFDTNMNDGSTTPQFYSLTTSSYNNKDDANPYFIDNVSYNYANANYANGYTDGYYYDGTMNRISLVVTFDTNKWEIVYGGNVYHLTDVLIDRYGYTWMGWYVSPDSTLSSTFKEFFNTNGSLNWTSVDGSNQIIDASTYADRDVLARQSCTKFDYEWICKTNYEETKFDTSYHYANNGVDRIDTLVRLDLEYLNNEEIENDHYDATYYNHNVYGKFTLYAGWQANTYKVSYGYGTNGIDKDAKNDTASLNTNTSIAHYAGSLDTIKNEPFLDTTTPLQHNSGDYFELVFDCEYDPQYVTRIGYTFLGWRLGLHSENIIDKGDKIEINYDYIKNENVADTGNGDDCYLYEDKSKLTTPDDEFLGTPEVLGDTESGNNIDNHFIIMFAVWEANIYKVNININKGAADTTVAYYGWDSNNLTNSQASGLISITLNVEFDTNEWYFESTGDTLLDIEVAKEGYFWIGWYTNAEAVEGKLSGTTDFLTSGNDYDYENAYNSYIDKIDALDSYLGIYRRVPTMRILDYSLFNQFVFRTYAEVSTNDDLYDLEDTLGYSNNNGYVFNGSTTYGNWIESRSNSKFELTIYAKWQGIIYETTFDATSFGNGTYEIGSTTAYYITAANGTYTSTTAKCNMYVMFDKNLYTSNYQEILDIESDYTTGTIVGEHIKDVIKIDRYGYSWTGWYTRGYEAANKTQRLATDGSTYFYVGDMAENSKLIVDGHDKGLKTFKSNYSTLMTDADYAKFTKSIYDTLLTKTTTYTEGNPSNTDVYEMTLYAGWKANSYNVYYESNDS